MTQLPVDAVEDRTIPEPEIQRGRRFSIVWLIPLIAALVAIWLGVKSVRETGPTITIIFKSAEGLVPGKTQIKYKDVTVGKVDNIQLSDDLSQVLVTAAMSREVAVHLTENTKFWVVRARVAVGEVSGIGTLLTGAYIGMIPGDPGKTVYRFEGREKPPAILPETPGRQFKLRAEQLGSLDIGSPVYYRQVKVGRVTDVDMAKDGTGVLLEIFVKSPYDVQVKRDSRFYNTSGLNVNITAEGVRVDTPSLASLLVGGISFFTADGQQTMPAPSANHIFTLYDNREAANAASYSYRVYYLLYIEESVRGLSAGAPVEFYGIKIGEVVNIRLLFNQDALTFRIPVLIAIEPDRIEFAGESAVPGFKLVEELVEKGLRAQLRTGNLITGQSYVCLRIYPDAPYQKILKTDAYPVLPTIPNTVEEIAATAKRFLARLERLPLDETIGEIREAARQVTAMIGSESLESAIHNIDQSFAEFKKVTGDFNDGTLIKMNGVLDQAKESLAQGKAVLSSAATMLDQGAPAFENLNRLLLELQETARAVEALADYLERHPDAIVFGKGEEP